MMNCQNCGQINSGGSNFCRFCGVNFKFAQPQPSQEERVGYDHSPPRPYSWKTDEFQVKPEKETRPINRVRPLVSSPPMPTQKDMQIPNQYPATYEQQSLMSYGYNCPRCSSLMLPKTDKKISTAGWIVFAVLLLTFFPLFWIGFLMKEEVKICPVCNLRIN